MTLMIHYSRDLHRIKVNSNDIEFQINLVKSDPQIIAYDEHDGIDINIIIECRTEIHDHLSYLVKKYLNNSTSKFNSITNGIGSNLGSNFLVSFCYMLCKKLLKYDILWSEIHSYMLQIGFKNIYEIELYIEYCSMRQLMDDDFNQSPNKLYILGHLSYLIGHNHIYTAKILFDAIELILKRKKLTWDEFEHTRVQFLLSLN